MFSSKQLIKIKNAFYLKVVRDNNIKCLINCCETRYYYHKCLQSLSTRNDYHSMSPLKRLGSHRHQSTEIAPKQSKHLEKLPKKKAFVGIAGIEENLSNEKLAEIEWKRVYFCPFIHLARFIARFKMYQTILMVAFVPIGAALYRSEQMSLIKFQQLCAFSLLACMVLMVFGQIFRRLVGAVYISECGKRVRIAHLTFFGNRRDIYLNISDMVPLSDVNDNLTDFYCNVERFSTEDKLLMSLKFGGILDREGFEAIFGKDSAIFAAHHR